ncbi:slit homolog 3 protein-like [Hypanus sabinus]|uniref:slit homolog 3 protein-like n=1 Tax=Hypanus sabinus TaxID=79690 RepID=UPI0028C38A78|nr:slit homolog 3 protein-like [Hypanus sabinus]XP_059831042.1 slit homolog 3 protein-like [Hypanus sabinus]
MWQSRIQYLLTFCCLYTMVTSLISAPCIQYIDLEGKVGMNCSNRSLDSIPLSLPTDTEVLLLSFNNITSVSLSSFTNLTKLHDLDLSNNQIRHLHSDYTLSVQKLDLSSNALTTLPDFTKLPLLRKLVLDVNKISALPEGAFAPLINLEDLSIKGNVIVSVPDHIFDPLEKLRYLTLSANKIEEFPKDTLGRLEELHFFDISNNKLRTIPEDFFENNLLFYVYLYNNPWDCECSAVRYLKGWIDENDGNIYKNEGEPDSETVVCATPTTWQGTPIINITAHQICPSVTTEVMTLRTTVDETPTTFDTLFHQTSPHQEICAQYIDLEGKLAMNCSNRSLDSIPLSLPTDTEVLLLSFNNITSVSLSSFTNLTKLHDLDLSNNQIRHLHTDYTLSVQKLDLSSNALTTLPDFTKLPLLRKLVLDVNKISALPEGAFAPLNNLEDLSIKGNVIVSVPDHIFDPLEKLRYLTLSANKIEEFPKDTLGRLEGLHFFDISNNKLRTIPQDFFENNTIFYVYLYNNPWDCECSAVRYLKGWIDENDGNIYKNEGEPDSETVVCATPTTWQGTPIINITAHQICPSVTTEVMTLRTTVDETPTTFDTLFHQTSPHQEICAQYIDLEGKLAMNCSNRSLDSIPLSLPTDTEVLLLSFNNITSVSLSSFTNLTKLHDLDLSNNQIRHLHTDYTLSVQKLDLSSNALTTLPDFTKLPLLRKLVLDVNEISALPEGAFTPLINLEDLSIKGNVIVSIPDHIFDPLEELRYLTLSANKIEEFPKDTLGRLEGLHFFDISNNKLRTIPQDFFENNTIFYVYLYNNPWDCECSAVRYLKGWIDENDGNIYKNEGEPDSETVVCATPTTWQGTPIINITAHQICPSVTTEVMTLRTTVDETPTTFDTLFHQTSPHQEICAQYIDLEGKLAMNCSNRSLDSIPLSLPTDTEVLLLSFNNVTSVSLSSFTNLTKLHDLDLSNNQIRHLHTDYTLSVQKLDLSSNALTTLPDFTKLPLLRKLVLDVNEISALPEGAFAPLINLEDLSIKGNVIVSIPDHIFDPLEELRHLTLSANKIKEFPKDALSRMVILETFDISSNVLRTIPQGLFENQSLLHVLLYDNPWDCNCSIHYMVEWININRDMVYSHAGVNDSTSVTCKAPPDLYGRPLIHIAIGQICAVTTSVTSAPVSTPAAPSDPSDPSTTNTFIRSGRRSGLLEFLRQLGRNCLLLFTLLCLSLGLVLFEISALSFYILRFHRRLYRPLRQLSRRSWYIRLVRYSLVLPYLQQIYPPPRAAFSPDATEASPLEEEEWTSNATEAAGDAFTSFL